MAWLSLVVIVVVFYFPGLGLAHVVVGKNLVIEIPLRLIKISIPIPYTGPLRLFITLLFTWFVVKKGLYFWYRYHKVQVMQGKVSRWGQRWDRWLSSWVWAEYPWLASERFAVSLARAVLLAAVIKVLLYWSGRVLLFVLAEHWLNLGEFTPFVRDLVGGAVALSSQFTFGPLMPYMVLAFFIVVIYPNWQQERSVLQQEFVFRAQRQWKKRQGVLLHPSQ